MHIKTTNAQAQHAFFYEFNRTKKQKKTSKKTPVPKQNKTQSIYELGWRGILLVAAAAERIRERSINSSKWVRFSDLLRVRAK